MNKRKHNNKQKQDSWRWFLMIIPAVFALLLGKWLVTLGLDGIRDFRQLERIPRTTILAVLPGEVNLSGAVEPQAPLLSSPATRTPSIYYRYVVERKSKDSDGNTSWSTERTEIRSVNFTLRDDTGSIPVLVNSARIEAEQRYRRESGDYRYTEYRIEPGDRVFIFGYVQQRDAAMQVVFTQSGNYTPLISSRGELRERQGMAGSSMAAYVGGILLLSMAVLFACYAFRIHQTAYMLTATALMLVTMLIYLAIETTRYDLDAAASRQTQAQSTAQTLLTQYLREAGISWDGEWQTLASANPPQAGLTQSHRARVDGIRLNLHTAAIRTLDFQQRWPERWIARFYGIAAPEPIPVTEAETDQLAYLHQDFATTHLPAWLTLLLVVAGLGLSISLGAAGFRVIKVKRMIENLPTTKSPGVVYGLNELLAEVEVDPQQAPLVSPISAKPCYYYRYVVKEKRRQNNKTTWVTIEDREESQRFLLRDREGVIPIEPAGAEMITTHSSKRSSGNRTYQEYRLEPGDQVYVLGSAQIDPRTESSLWIRRGEPDLPFIISTHSERSVMLRKARIGFLWLNLGMISGVVGALGYAGGTGAFGALSYLSAAFVPLLYLSAALVILMYNDLVFLRQRVRTAWSNIDVSLQKRAELLPNLEGVVKSFMQHEREIQADLASLRSAAQTQGYQLNSGQQLVAAEKAVLNRLLAVQEQHPDLKANELIQKVTQTLIVLENEVALMREGFNNAVERYNNRCQQIPEVLIAQTFRFGDEKPFRANAEVLQVPRVDVTPTFKRYRPVPVSTTGSSIPDEG